MDDQHASHVVLVGLMASGKTTIGRRVAKRLERTFVDADDLLEQRAGRSVRDIFANDGEAAFRRLESELLGELLNAAEPQVIATGGGVVVAPVNRQRLKRAGAFVVWLYADASFLTSRAEGKASRPLLDDDPASTLARLAAEREPWYREVADVTIDIRPAFRERDKPKAHLADVIAELVRDREQAAADPRAAV
ncbi:MAG: shikimate kinase [Acidimicrobiaceae bacterium]